MPTLKGLYILDASALAMVYGPDERASIAQHVDMIAPPQTAKSIAERPELLAEIDVLFAGWGPPRIDAAFLAKAPKLRAIFYAGGGVGSWITQAVWDRDIAVTSAIVANSIPVAEYVLATTLFSLKHGWSLARQTRERQTFPGRDEAPGCYGTTVGLVSLGTVARILARLLEPFDLRVIAYDPFVDPADAEAMGVELVSLDAVFRQSDVVSLHTPEMPETRGLITGRHFELMRPGSTFLNTARGGIVREAEMIDVLRRRPDLHAVLDVTDPEPPVVGSPLYTLPNVILTPHIAGSVGAECRRMGHYMIAELERFVAGRPLKWAVTAASAAHTSHSPLERAAEVVGGRTAALVAASS